MHGLMLMILTIIEDIEIKGVCIYTTGVRIYKIGLITTR